MNRTHHKAGLTRDADGQNVAAALAARLQPCAVSPQLGAAFEKQQLLSETGDGSRQALHDGQMGSRTGLKAESGAMKESRLGLGPEVASTSVDQTPDVVDVHALNAGVQLSADVLVSELEALTVEALGLGLPNPQLLFDVDRFPAASAWLALRKHAIALHPLYEAGEVTTLGEGLDWSDFTSPLVGDADAVELLSRSIGPDRASLIADRYRTFLDQEIDPAWRLLIQGCADARGIRLRAAAARTMLRDRAPRWRDSPVRLVSLACGAAGPVASFAEELTDDGVTVGEVVLIDRDPMALAAARSIARRRTTAPVSIALVDLVDLPSGSAVDLTGPARGSADVIDLLGLFEYLPDPVAVDVLRRAREIIRPAGGVVVLANMLRDRPQQVMFEHVVQWPALIQRSTAEVVRLIVAAGWESDAITTLIPDDCVYAVFALDTTLPGPLDP